jgi:DNA-3-methyladenine glycosylase II
MNLVHLTVEAPFGYSLAAAAEFYAGFAPMGGAAQKSEATLQLAFLLDRTFEPVLVTLRQDGTRLELDIEGTENVRAVRTQLGRMLGLDVDGKAWADVLAGDPSLAEAASHYPGFFTAGFPSPYEAGIGGILSHRSSVKQASAIRKRLSLAHGTKIGELTLMPSPKQLLAVKSFPGIPSPKLDVLHGLARAALDGFLDAERLRALPVEHAMEQLEQLRGVGPWTAGHLLFRGCSLQDALPTTEPRVLRAFTLAYGFPDSEFARVAQAWRPFRMWVSIVLVRNLARHGQWAAVPSDFARRGRRQLVG